MFAAATVTSAGLTAFVRESTADTFVGAPEMTPVFASNLRPVGSPFTE